MAETYHKRGKPINGYWPIRTHPNYVIWAGIKSRCTAETGLSYKNYRSRGITYCDRWKHFENFCEDMGMRPTPEHTIERINNDIGYTPDNCKWATSTEQCLNRRAFSNSKTQTTGVVQIKNGRFIAQFNYNKKRYRHSGTFATLEEAEAAYKELRSKVMHGADVSKLLERTARYDSTTKIKGITVSKDGYIVRVTENKKRKYLGIRKTLEEAKEVLVEWKESKK